MPDIKAQTRKLRQSERRTERFKAVAERRNQKEMLSRIERKGFVYYYKYENCWYHTVMHYSGFIRWYESYFGVKMENELQELKQRKDFGEFPPVAFDADRTGY